MKNSVVSNAATITAATTRAEIPLPLTPNLSRFISISFTPAPRPFDAPASPTEARSIQASFFTPHSHSPHFASPSTPPASTLIDYAKRKSLLRSQRNFTNETNHHPSTGYNRSRRTDRNSLLRCMSLRLAYRSRRVESLHAHHLSLRSRARNRRP